MFEKLYNIIRNDKLKNVSTNQSQDPKENPIMFYIKHCHL